MIDFGKHTFHVWASYGITVGLLIALVAVTLRQSSRAKARLEQVEKTNG